MMFTLVIYEMFGFVALSVPVVALCVTANVYRCIKSNDNMFVSLLSVIVTLFCDVFDEMLTVCVGLINMNDAVTNTSFFLPAVSRLSACIGWPPVSSAGIRYELQPH